MDEWKNGVWYNSQEVGFTVFFYKDGKELGFQHFICAFEITPEARLEKAQAIALKDCLENLWMTLKSGRCSVWRDHRSIREGPEVLEFDDWRFRFTPEKEMFQLTEELKKGAADVVSNNNTE